MLKLLFIYSDTRDVGTVADILASMFTCRILSRDDIADERVRASLVHFDAILTDSSDLLRVLPKSLADIPCITLPFPPAQKNVRVPGLSAAAIMQTADIIKNIVTQEILDKKNQENNELLDRRFVGTSEKIAAVKLNIRKFAVSNEPVLIIGESGTGKEIAAELLHRLSARKTQPYVMVNAAGIPDTLAESEFFGVVAGAYTDAVPRKGLFQAANNGTLFLDEIESITRSLQSKLLRVIDRRILMPLGTAVPETVNVRLITASNSTIEALKEYCRADFFYRICNLVLFLPPLRERKEDIPFLLNSFQMFSAPYSEISGEALDKLMEHDWPGNVRELKSCYLRACALSDGAIKAEHIQFF